MLEQVGTQGVFTRAYRLGDSGLVTKPIHGLVTENEFEKLLVKHQDFIRQLNRYGVLVPETRLIASQQSTGRLGPLYQISVEQKLFEEHQLATHLVLNAAPELALQVAKCIFSITLKVAEQLTTPEQGFHGSLRNFAILQQGSQLQANFIDTFPPFNSPVELLEHLSRHAAHPRMRKLAALAANLPNSILQKHSIFNPVNMLAGLSHSIARRRPELMASFIPWAIQEIRQSPASWIPKLEARLAQGFSHNPLYRKLFALVQ